MEQRGKSEFSARERETQTHKTGEKEEQNGIQETKAKKSTMTFFSIHNFDSKYINIVSQENISNE